MITEFTPGPWKRGNHCVVTDNPTPSGKVMDDESQQFYGAKNLIAETIQSNNLNLIAAAPEMLELIIEIYLDAFSAVEQGDWKTLEMRRVVFRGRIQKLLTDRELATDDLSGKRKTLISVPVWEAEP